VQTVRRASEGRTRLLIQIIDFLAVRRRPEPEKFFARFLEIQPWHRERLGAEDWPEVQVRTVLAGLPEDELARVLETRELDAHRFGYREPVTDTDLAHVRELPRVLPDLFAQAARRAREAGFDGSSCTMRTPHDGVVPPRLNDRADGYGRARDGACGCRWRSSAAYGTSRARTTRSAAASSPRNASRAATRRGHRVLRRRVRARRDGLPVAVARRQVR
jgi:hypothetical protein